MGVLDFLFEGSPPPSVTTYGSTTENLPQWLSDYNQALIARANTVAAEGYVPYEGPRVAGFNQDQLNSFDVVRNNIGDWQDEVGQGSDAIQGGLSQAMPYFQQAGQSTPDQIGRYMDPYVGNVIDRATQVADRNFNENLMPAISGRFIRGGQSGSTAHQDMLQRGARDTSEGLQSQAMAALSDAYRTAGSQFSTDASRFGQVGSAVGNLGIQGGQAMANIGNLQSNLGLRDAGALQAVGEAEQGQTQKNLDTAYGDFTAQRDFPRQNVDWMSSVIRGMPHDTTTNTTENGPANVYQPSLASQLTSLYGLYRDMTDDKARGGRVKRRYADGGPVEAMMRGEVMHIPGPIRGHYRYADGGLVALEH